GLTKYILLSVFKLLLVLGIKTENTTGQSVQGMRDLEDFSLKWNIFIKLCPSMLKNICGSRVGMIV
ncbi:hypothetical protein ACQP3L_35340, partial [Escherichia coli]